MPAPRLGGRSTPFSDGQPIKARRPSRVDATQTLVPAQPGNVAVASVLGVMALAAGVGWPSARPLPCSSATSRSSLRPPWMTPNIKDRRQQRTRSN